MIDIDLKDEIFQRFPEFSCHALLVSFPRDLKISAAKLESLEKMIYGSASSWPDPISNLDSIRVWRRAFRMMGLKPTKTLSSVEALVKRANKYRWKTGNTIVDIYNALSIINEAPIGGYDIDSFSDSTISIRNAIPSKDIFYPLSGNSEKYNLTSDIIVYAQGHSILCWGINHKDSIRFSINETSRNCLFISEGVSDLHRINSKNALCQLKELTEELGAECSEVSSVFGNGKITIK